MASFWRLRGRRSDMPGAPFLCYPDDDKVFSRRSAHKAGRHAYATRIPLCRIKQMETP